MVVVPVLVSVIWIALARSRDRAREDPLVPSTTVGRMALASLALVIVVALADASLIATVPAGVVMLGLASLARWIQRDRGLLLVVPLAFGLSTLALPLLFE